MGAGFAVQLTPLVRKVALLTILSHSIEQKGDGDCHPPMIIQIVDVVLENILQGKLHHAASPGEHGLAG